MAAPWLYWALASAFFAALTAIFAKAGLQGIDSDFATFIRTLVIIAALALFLSYTGKWQGIGSFTVKNWQMGEAYQVAPVDKLSLVLVAVLAVVFLGERPNLREWLGLAMISGGVWVLAFKR